LIRAKVSASQTLALLDRVRTLKASGKDVVSFAAGEADFATPRVVIDEAVKQMNAGNTRYVSTLGSERLRQLVAKDYKERLGVSWIGPDNVLPTFGAKQAIYLALAALLERGEEVLVPKPFWVSYPGLVKAAGGKVVEVTTQESKDFFPTVAELEAASSDLTRAVIFSSPSNPLGTMIRREVLLEIVEWARARNVLVIFDEIYERLVLDTKREHVTPLALGREAELDNVLCVNACSKSLAMTGWRLGYAVSTRSNIEALRPLQGQMITCLPGFVQEAGAAGLEKVNELLPPIIENYRRRLKMMTDALARIPNLRFVPPAGAFYVAVDVSEVMRQKGFRSDVDFAERFLQQELVAVLPGTSMGMPGWIRLSFATSDEEIRKGLERLAKFVA
jgi:aspartate aminotransferase